jgi:hypothetical protein
MCDYSLAGVSKPAGSRGRTTGGPTVFHRRPGLGGTNYTPGMVVVRKRVRRLRAPRRWPEVR